MIKIINEEEEIKLNPLEKKDFERMSNMKTTENIVDYLYEITMSQNEEEAYETLKNYLSYAFQMNNKPIKEAIITILHDSFGVNELKDLFK